MAQAENHHCNMHHPNELYKTSNASFVHLFCAVCGKRTEFTKRTKNWIERFESPIIELNLENSSAKYLLTIRYLFVSE